MSEPLPLGARPAYSRAEVLGLAGLLGIFFAFNLSTLLLFPPVWYDEVSYADPAINLLTTGKFQSTLGHVQPGGRFWASNVPLYSLALFGWLKVAGLSIEAVRALNLVLMAAVVVIVWWWSRSTGAVASPTARLGLAGYLLFAFGITFNYRGGRPDCLNMLLCVSLLCALRLRSPATRWPAVIALSALLPWAGLQSLVYLAILCGIAFLFWRQPRVSDGLAIGVGFALGLLTLYALYRSHGAWDDLRLSVQYHSVRSLPARLGRGEFTLRGFVPADPSLVIAYAGAALAVLFQWRRGEPLRRSPLLFALATAVALQVLMPILARYPTYYAYMAHFPLALALAHVAANGGAAVRAERMVAGGALVAGALLGAPLHLANALADPEGRDYRAVERFVEAHVPAGAFVFMEPAAYYAVRKRTPHYFIWMSLTSMRNTERQQMSVMLVNPDAASSYTAQLGGRWERTGDHLAAGTPRFLGLRWNVGFMTLPKYNLELWQKVE